MAGTLWPVRPALREDELLSSWIVRIAAANGMKLHTFSVNRLNVPSMWNRDIDGVASDTLIELLENRTGVSKACIAQTTLRDFEGTLFQRFNSRGTNPWILPLGIWHRVRSRFGVQYCPECLAESSHVRRLWRLAFIVICPKHQRQLLDACPGCDGPFMYHRADLGDRYAMAGTIEGLCPDCGHDLCKVDAPYVRSDDPVFELQAVLEEALRKHRADLHGHIIDAVPFFAGLRTLCRMCITGHYAKAIRDELAGRLAPEALRPVSAEKGRAIEQLRIGPRLQLMRLLVELLKEWPSGFIKTAREIALAPSRVAAGQVQPYWLATALDAIPRGQASMRAPSSNDMRVAAAYVLASDRSIDVRGLASFLGIAGRRHDQRLAAALDFCRAGQH